MEKTLSDYIMCAIAADDEFERVIKACGYKDRWQWRGSAKCDCRPQTAYEAKIKADSEMHYAWERHNAVKTQA